jgi:hypothetical protein
LSVQAYRALMIRGDALNRLYGAGAAGPSRAEQIRAAALDRRYGNAWTRVSAAEFRRLARVYGDDLTKLTPQQARAMLAWGEGQDEVAARYARVSTTASAGPSGGFDWEPVWLGIGSALGAAFVAAAGALVIRRRGRLVFHS